MSVANAVQTREDHIKALDKSLVGLKKGEKEPAEELIKILKKEVKDLEKK